MMRRELDIRSFERKFATKRDLFMDTLKDEPFARCAEVSIRNTEQVRDQFASLRAEALFRIVRVVFPDLIFLFLLPPRFPSGLCSSMQFERRKRSALLSGRI